jgi:putative glutamine amidotransferase
MPRPVIGITTYVEPASWGAWRDIPAALIPHAYVRQVAEAGGLPVLIPPLPAGTTREDLDRLLGRIEGLILAGGGDVEPVRYGAEPHPSVQAPRPQRDDSELDLARASGESGLPVLGICRGMQVLNVALGGSLHQHIPDLGVEVNHRQDGLSTEPSHRVTLARDSRLTKVIGRRYVEVNSYHHQALHALGRGLSVAGRAPDGIVEAVEASGRRFTFGVQWHAECLVERPEHLSLFRGLVRAARGHEVAPRMVA